MRSHRVYLSEIDTNEEGLAKEEGEEARDSNGRRHKTRSILFTVARKLIYNPNTHATILGLIWASIRFRYTKHNTSALTSLMFGDETNILSGGE